MVDFGLGGLALTLRTLGKGNCEGYGVVHCFLEHVRTYTNVLFLFLVDFGLSDLELMLRTLGKGNCKGGGVVCCFLIM